MNNTLYSPSYSPNYYSLDDILATNEKVPCTFKRDMIGLGYLDASDNVKDLVKGNNLELPLWMGIALYRKRKIVVCEELPQAYGEKYREPLEADANLVDLHALGPYYYEYGLHLLDILGPQGAVLGMLMREALKQRLRKIMDYSLNSVDDDAPTRKTTFDQLERSLYDTGRMMYQDHQLWVNRRCHIIDILPAVEHMKKRKHSETE